MSQEHAVGLQLLHGGERCRRAVQDLIEAIPGGDADEPEAETGVFEVRLEARSQEEALHTVWNAIAQTGCDDHVVFVDPRALASRPGGRRRSLRRPAGPSA
jgi:hypothetical protein